MKNKRELARFITERLDSACIEEYDSYYDVVLDAILEFEEKLEGSQTE
mgnify:CR=1 FL=1